MDTEASNQCPSFEDLSAWHDGELKRAELDKHVADCQACLETLTFFKKVDAAVAEDMVVSDELLARLESSTAEKIAAPATDAAPIRIPISFWTRVAALFALIGVIFYLNGVQENTQDAVADNATKPTAEEYAKLTEIEKEIHNQLMAEKEAGLPLTSTMDTTVPPPAPVAAATQEATTDVAAVVAPRLKENTTPALPPPHHDGVDLRDIRLVGIELAPENSRRARRSLIAAAESEVGDYVRHVWTTQNPQKPLAVLKTLMAKRNHAMLDQLIQQEQDRYRLQLIISDKDLQAFVNHLDQIGLNLVSAAAPQPGLVSSKVHFSGKPIRYDVEFLKP